MENELIQFIAIIITGAACLWTGCSIAADSVRAACGKETRTLKRQVQQLQIITEKANRKISSLERSRESQDRRLNVLRLRIQRLLHKQSKKRGA